MVWEKGKEENVKVDKKEGPAVASASGSIADLVEADGGRSRLRLGRERYLRHKLPRLVPVYGGKRVAKGFGI